MVLLVSGFAATIKANSVSVIPRPVRLEMKEGKFLFKPGMAILADSAVAAEGRFFARSLAPALGFTLKVSTSRIGSAPHVEMKLVRSLEKLGDEGYRLNVSPKRILLTAPTAAGIFLWKSDPAPTLASPDLPGSENGGHGMERALSAD